MRLENAELPDPVVEREEVFACPESQHKHSGSSSRISDAMRNEQDASKSCQAVFQQPQTHAWCGRHLHQRVHLPNVHRCHPLCQRRRCVSVAGFGNNGHGQFTSCFCSGSCTFAGRTRRCLPCASRFPESTSCRCSADRRTSKLSC